MSSKQRKRPKMGRPKTGRTARLVVYMQPLYVKAIRHEAKERELTPGQIVEEAFSSRSFMINKDG